MVGLTIGSVISGILGDWVDRRFPKYGRILIAHVSIALSIIVSYFLFQVEYERTASYSILLLLFGSLVAFESTSASQPMLSTVLLPEVRSTGFILMRTTSLVGVAINAVIIGQLSDDYGLTQVFFWSITVSSIVLFVLWFGFYKIYANDAEQLQATLAQRRKLIEK
jgi:MFS family permease